MTSANGHLFPKLPAFRSAKVEVCKTAAPQKIPILHCPNDAFVGVQTPFGCEIPPVPFAKDSLQSILQNKIVSWVLTSECSLKKLKYSAVLYESRYIPQG